MKKKQGSKGVNLKFIIGGTLVMAIIIGIAITTSNGKGTMPVKEGGVLSVNDIQADPYAYKGTITITGVAADKSRYRLPKDFFLMVETSEARICKQTGCAKFYLPVKYDGEMPKEWDEVNVTGSFAEGDILFIAKKVDVLRHLTL